MTITDITTTRAEQISAEKPCVTVYALNSWMANLPSRKTAA